MNCEDSVVMLLYERLDLLVSFQPACCSYHLANVNVIQRCFVFKTDVYGEGSCYLAFIEAEGRAVPGEVKVPAWCKARCCCCCGGGSDRHGGGRNFFRNLL